MLIYIGLIVFIGFVGVVFVILIGGLAVGSFCL